jgi:hypothetical protein
MCFETCVLFLADPEKEWQKKAYTQETAELSSGSPAIVAEA